MDSAIGVFDSGLGGLTCVKQLRRLAPDENIVFFGDTARIPYGTKSPKTIVDFALQDMTFLLSRGVKLIIAACGTVSSNLPERYARALPVPFVGIVEPTAEAAAHTTKNGRIGILGTSATVKSGALEKAVRRFDKDARVTSVACPMFVPLVENGYTARDCGITRAVALDYLAPLKAAGVDTVVLGCTHYPIIADIIADIMGEGVTLVDSGLETAKRALGLLDSAGLRGGSGRISYNISDDPEGFLHSAEAFLGGKISGGVNAVSLDGTAPHSCFGSLL